MPGPTRRNSTLENQLKYQIEKMPIGRVFRASEVVKSINLTPRQAGLLMSRRDIAIYQGYGLWQRKE